MKSIYGYLTGALLGLLGLPAAHAQTTTTPAAYGIGTCTSSSDGSEMLTGTTQLEIGDVLVPQASGGAVFNLAECQCQSRDIGMRVVLTAGTGLGPAAPGVEMYIGDADCSDYSLRPTRVCDQVTANSPPNNGTWSVNGTSFQSAGMFDVSIPPEPVTNPMPAAGVGYTCNTGGITTQTVTLTIGLPMTPAVCNMPVTVNTVGPTAPQDLSIASGDSGLVVNWDVPPNTGGIENYQVLCRKKSDPTQPAMSADFLNSNRYYFSSCINDHLFRRLPGGTAVPSDTATTTDVPISTNGFPVDPRLRCSDHIPIPQGTARITGLTNGEEYEVMVVSIDPYGNASPSVVVTGTPRETEAPITDFCVSGCPGFGCTASGSTRTSAGAGMAVAGLLAIGLLLGTRRVRRAT